VNAPPASRRPTSPTHLPSLDGLRGLAIALVLLHNLDVLEPTAGRAIGTALLKELFYVGWIGVQLFFVLSGFLITRGLIQMQGLPGYFQGFFVKRVLRIFPLYYLALIVFVEVLPLTGLAEVRPMTHSSAWMWLYLSNWTTPFEPGGGPMPHFWSLAVEEQFYLLWPLLLWRLRLRDIWLLCLMLIGLSPLLRVLLISQGAPAEAIYEFTISRMDALAAGAALATWDQGREVHGSTRWRATHLGMLSVVLLGVTGWWSNGFHRLGDVAQVGGYSLLTVAFTALTGWALLNDQATFRGALLSHAARLLSSAPLRLLGKYSYALYVFHKPLHDLVGEPLLVQLTGQSHTADPWVALAYLGAAGATTGVIAWLSWQLFERHFLALKDRWARVPADPATVAPSILPEPVRPRRGIPRGRVTAAQRRRFRSSAQGLLASLLRGQPAPRR
jgi:peptidoglycan/LPS O-acetylase OafA/YrhL